MPVAELALGLYMSAAVAFVVDRGIWFSLPFLVLFQAGYLYVAVLSVLQSRRAPAAAKATA